MILVYGCTAGFIKNMTVHNCLLYMYNVIGAYLYVNIVKLFPHTCMCRVSLLPKTIVWSLTYLSSPSPMGYKASTKCRHLARSILGYELCLSHWLAYFFKLQSNGSPPVGTRSISFPLSWLCPMQGCLRDSVLWHSHLHDQAISSSFVLFHW